MIKKNSPTILLVLTIFILFTFSSCDPVKKYEKREASQIQDYLDKNSDFDFELKPSGLYYLEVEAGTGPQPVTHDTSYTKYTGKMLDGTIFDSNIGGSDTLKMPVNEGWLIAGFDEGITLMKEGGKAVLLIPSKLGYGSSGIFPYIDGYTPLLFEVELARVKAGPGQ